MAGFTNRLLGVVAKCGRSNRKQDQTEWSANTPDAHNACQEAAVNSKSQAIKSLRLPQLFYARTEFWESLGTKSVIRRVWLKRWIETPLPGSRFTPMVCQKV